jgi:hypothetical protein
MKASFRSWKSWKRPSRLQLSCSERTSLAATVWRCCADFLAGANLDNGDLGTLLFSRKRFFRFLPEEQRYAFLGSLGEHRS